MKVGCFNVAPLPPPFMKLIYIYIYNLRTSAKYIQGVLGKIVHILGGGSMDCYE